jgi:hypothetical protein
LKLNTPEWIRTTGLWFRSRISIFPALSFQPFRLTIFARFGCCLGLAAHCLPTSVAHQKQTKSFGLLLKRLKYGRRLLRSPVVSPQRKRTRRKRAPRCIIIAGPNGAGKTTFAEEFLPKYAKVVHFVNADLIASGISPLRPELAAIRAGRLLLNEIDRLAASSTPRCMSFAFGHNDPFESRCHHFRGQRLPVR